MSGWRDFLDPVAPTGRYLPWKEVAHATGLSRTTAWRLHRRDEFPRPYPISPGRVAYLEREVEAWKAWRQHLGPSAGSPPIERVAETPQPPRARPTLHPSRPPRQSDEDLRPPKPAPNRSSMPRRRPRSDGRQINFDF